MQLDNLFFLNSLLFGVGLAVDAFIVALANGLNFPKMPRVKTFGTAGLFSVFQLMATMLGWLIASFAFARFAWIEVCFSWAAVVVISVLGIKMIIEAVRNSEEAHIAKSGIGALIAQCAATSVDALTVGFTVEEYGALSALLCAAIIASVTFASYSAGVSIGKRFGMKFGKAASVIGGIMFLAIAVEIIVTTYC